MAQTQYLTADRLMGEENQKRSKVRKILWLIGLAVAGYVWWALEDVQFAAAIFAVWFVLSLFLFKADDRIVSGAVGEQNALMFAKQLPDEFTLFNQVDIPNERSSTKVNEADLVICGPQAVFVVESKNNKGSVEGVEEDDKWIANKVGRGGGAYQKKIRNPVKQAKQQAFLLKNYLKSKQAAAWVQPIALFTHEEAYLQIAYQKISVPVLHREQLVKYIREFEAPPHRSGGKARPVRKKTVNAILELKQAELAA